MSTNTGGPAFPVDRQTAHGIAVHEVGKGNEAAYSEAVAQLSQGMTLRDYFAAEAMQGICASGPGSHMTNERIAAEAYDLANAMLKARES